MAIMDDIWELGQRDPDECEEKGMRYRFGMRRNEDLCGSHCIIWRRDDVERCSHTILSQWCQGIFATTTCNQESSCLNRLTLREVSVMIFQELLACHGSLEHPWMIYCFSWQKFTLTLKSELIMKS
jgi:hypothetical protein